MFTGLIEALGQVQQVIGETAGRRLIVSEPRLAPELEIGESIAVNGACLTVVEAPPDGFAVQVGPETLVKTNLGELQPGDRVNLERSLRVGDRLGGHWVQGHIDGTARIAARHPADEWQTVWFACDPALTLQMVPKGSIAVDGVSLTLVSVERERFSVMLIPHTLAHTTLGFKPVGATVNLETDILGKYVQKLMTGGQ